MDGCGIAVWHSGTFGLRGGIEDALIVLGMALAGGYAWQRFSRSEAT
jgi:hypothetical protein